MEESLVIAHELDDPQLIANGIYGLGIVVAFPRETMSTPKSCSKEFFSLFRQLGDRIGTYISLYNLAEAATARDDYKQAQSLHEESLALKRAQGDEWSIANSLLSLATLAAASEQLFSSY